MSEQDNVYDFVVIGSGFGGSVSAMRLAEKGYRVLVLERGKRYRDEDFARSNWNIWKYLWLPALRCFGIFQMSFFKDITIFHGSGVGGGSLGFANVLMEPGDELFDAAGWRDLADWKAVLKGHYETARTMLGVTANTRLWAADDALRVIAEEMGQGHSFGPADVGVFFGAGGDEEGKLVPDPFFGGEGPERATCIHCGGCMVGCRYNAKNTLVKNYLYFAEKWGAQVRAEATVQHIQPLAEGQADGARYEITYNKTTAIAFKRGRRVRARNVVMAAGVLGTLKLLLHCRDIARTLPELSSRLGEDVRTNTESLTGVTALDNSVDYSKGISISSIFHADSSTTVEPVRYPDGSSFVRTLLAPLIETSGSVPARTVRVLWEIARHPVGFLHARFFSRWARLSTIILVMQTTDTLMHMRLGRNLFTGFRWGLATERDKEKPVPANLAISHKVTRAFAERTNGYPASSFGESLFDTPSTAHIMGGCSFGRTAEAGVIDLNCEAFNYPGLYVVDGSIMPANPGINPSLTITALAEYAMSRIPAQEGFPLRGEMLGVRAAEILSTER